ncbi:MAG: YCF48-related protein [Ignavibacteria bacterium]|nr:YCF48-related protein [Ignavibacteria bacterium]
MKQLLLILSFYSILTWGQTDKPLSPDYRNHINIPKYSKENFPLQQQTVISGGVWTELNPKVPRVHYLCIHFASIDTGWAVGVEGTIIRTVDAGKTWETIKCPVNEILLNVNSYNSKVVIITGFNGTVLRSEDSGLTWEIPQMPDSITSDLWRVVMLNDTLGWMSGKGAVLLKTTDAGQTWKRVVTNYPNYNYWFVSFYKEKFGYIAGDYGKVLKTDDYGETWHELNIGDNKSLYTLTVFDSLRVVTGGQSGRVAYTNDGGKTWGLSIGGGLVNAMAFVNDTLGYNIGTDEYVYYQTTNGGVSWGIMGYPTTTRIGGNWIEFLNDTLGYIAGNYLRINFTTNAGYGWHRQFVMNEDIKDIFFANEKVGFALDYKYFYKTEDGGKSWVRGEAFYANTLYFLDPLNGFIGGQHHQIYATTDGGVTWDQKPILGLTDSTSTHINGFCFFDDSSVGYAYSGSGIFRTTDYGSSWEQISSPGASLLFFLTPLNVYKHFYDIFYSSSDGGKTWVQRGELHDGSVWDIFFMDSLNGFIAAANELYATSNGGQDWTLILTNNIGYPHMSWFTRQHGLLTGNMIYETNDGGLNWSDITETVGTGFNKMHSVNSSLGYGGGGLGLIIKYQDTTTVSINNEEEKLVYNLSLNNYPNPFNASTIIKFISPFSDYGTVIIYNILGEEAAVLFRGFIERNKEYKVIMSSSNLSSGIYFCRITTSTGYAAVKKLTIIK